MIKWLSALVFTSFILNCNSVTLSSETSGEMAANALARITDKKKVLPLPLCTIPQGEVGVDGGVLVQLRAPEDMVKAEIENGVMVQGTEFFLSNSQEQLFFCPSPNLTELCLVPGEFNNSKLLECTQELRAIVEEDEEPNRICNFRGGSYSTYRVIYEICPSDLYKYSTRAFVLYQFCYDVRNAKTLFTSHSILSPKLLYSPLLLREREVYYAYEEPMDDLIPANHAAIINLLNGQGRLSYRLAKLVPADDMALGVWRKTTSKPFNFEFLHMDLIVVWNRIGEKLREQVYRHRNHTKYLILTGVFDNQRGVNSTPTGQLYNRWIKVVIGKSTQDDTIFGGSVFLMNNFLDGEFEYPSFLEVLQFEMEELCPIDHCIDEFKHRVNDAKGTVKCCYVNSKIAKLFGYKKLFGYNLRRPLQFLSIEGLSSINESDPVTYRLNLPN